jgi:hypothetical protein
MANVAGLPEPRANRRAKPPSARRTVSAPETRAVPPPQERPADGIHPLAFRLPMMATAWFLISLVISFADTLETGYLMAIVVGFGIIFFGLTIGLALHASGSARWLGSAQSYRRFARGEVGVHTGRISGREAIVQLTVLPVTLALGGMAIGLVYIFVR